MFDIPGVDPINLSGVQIFDVLVNKADVWVEPLLLTNASYILLVRVSTTAGVTDTTIADFKPLFAISSGNSNDEPISVPDGYRVQGLLVDSSGTAANGGSGDNVLLRVKRR